MLFALPAINRLKSIKWREEEKNSEKSDLNTVKSILKYDFIHFTYLLWTSTWMIKICHNTWSALTSKTENRIHYVFNLKSPLQYFILTFHFFLELIKFSKCHNMFLWMSGRCLALWIITSPHYVEVGAQRAIGPLWRISWNWE